LSSPGRHDGIVSEPEERRARASLIFGRLRAAGDLVRQASPEPEDADRPAEEASLATAPLEEGEAASLEEGATPPPEEGATSPPPPDLNETAPVFDETAPASSSHGAEDPAPGGDSPPQTGAEAGIEAGTAAGHASAVPADTTAPLSSPLIAPSRTSEWIGHSPPPPPAPIRPGNGHRLAAATPTGAGPTAAGPDLTAVGETGPGPRRHPGAVAHDLPRRFAIANQKGGVGKTTTAVNLGAALAELDYRVLVVDLDPQGNATTGLGINGRNLDASVYDVILHDVPIEDVIEPTTLRNLFVVPATIDLAGAEIELVPVFSRELRLRRALETIDADFDYILIDCPPSLGLLTVNGLAAAGEVVVPIQCEYYALEGVGQLLRNVGLVQTNLNRDLEVSTIILTMYDARTRLAEQVVEEVRLHFGDRVCRNVVPRTVRLSEAPSFGQPIIVFDSSSRGAIAYRELAKEVSGGAPQRVR
jgi:chromosome partitioning protein